MKFQAAYSYLKHGYAITLPEWGGFWSWDPDYQTIVIHTRGGDVLDFLDTDDLDYTLSFLFRDDWEIQKDVSESEHVTNALAAAIAEAEEDAAYDVCEVCGEPLLEGEEGCDALDDEDEDSLDDYYILVLE